MWKKAARGSPALLIISQPLPALAEGSHWGIGLITAVSQRLGSVASLSLHSAQVFLKIFF